MNDLQRELEVATRAARHAGTLIKALYGGVADVRYKTPIEPVTDADLAADSALREQLGEAFPDDAWLSEESGGHLDRLEKRRVWIVDPLDGTREFVAGRPEFTVSVGLVVGGEPTLGVIVNPITGHCWSAIRGRGATCDGRPIHVAPRATLAEGQVLVSRSEKRRGALEQYEGLFPMRAVGGAAFKLALIAQGDALATFTTHTRCEWDVAAGLVILAEAGGRVTRLDGTPFRLNQVDPVFQGIVATNGATHDELRASVNRVIAAAAEK